MVNRTSRLSKNLTDIFGSTGASECRVCANPLGNPRRKYCCDRCQRIAYAVIRCYRWGAIREFVKERDGYACTAPECENDAATPGVSLHVDHITPLADDGPAHDPANLQTLCETCNMAKGAGDTIPEPVPDPDPETVTCPDCGHTYTEGTPEPAADETAPPTASREAAFHETMRDAHPERADGDDTFHES